MLRAERRYFWCEQATSYWETLFGLFEFCGCWPAYTFPAVPSGLKAEPGAIAAFPGVFGAVGLPQLWFGWPVRCVRVGAVDLVVGAVDLVVGAVDLVVGAEIVLGGLILKGARNAGGPASAAVDKAANATEAANAAVIERDLEGFIAHSLHLVRSK